MKRRRLFIVVSILAGVGCAIGAACTFPDVAFAPPGGAAGEAGSPDGEGGSQSDGPTGSDGGALDGSVIEAATRTDAEAKVDASGCVSCDCDDDSFFARDGGCEGGPGTVYDCDDSDKFIRPNQSFVGDFTWPSTVHSVAYDWNCDGIVEKAYPTGLSCAGTVVTGCTGGQGFMGSGPGCGTSADYFECKSMGTFCGAAKIDTRVQLCR